MKITATFIHDGDPTLMPRLVSAYDEFTFDGWGGVPDWHTSAVSAALAAAEFESEARTVVITVPDSSITDLFTPPPVAAVAVQPEN